MTRKWGDVESSFGGGPYIGQNMNTEKINPHMAKKGVKIGM